MPPAPPFVEVTLPVTLFFAPLVVALTLTENVQVVLTGIVAPLMETLVAPAAGLKVPAAQELVEEGVESTAKPDGKLSVTPTPVKATVFAEGFVIEMVKVDVSPTRMLAGENALAIVGGATTVMLALAVAPVPSSVVESVTELFFTPAVVPVTLTLNVQLALAVKVAPANEIELAPALAVIVPPPHEPV